MGSASSLSGLFPGGTWLTPAVPAFIPDTRLAIQSAQRSAGFHGGLIDMQTDKRLNAGAFQNRAPAFIPDTRRVTPDIGS